MTCNGPSQRHESNQGDDKQGMRCRIRDRFLNAHKFVDLLKFVSASGTVDITLSAIHTEVQFIISQGTAVMRF